MSFTLFWGLLGGVLIVGFVLYFWWNVFYRVERDISCAVKHKGLHEFIRKESRIVGSEDSLKQVTYTILYCPMCRRNIEASWSDESWEAIPPAWRKLRRLE